VLPTSRPPGENRYTSRYLDEEVTPLFPFGFGLSYTTFAYSNLRTQKPRAGRTETIVVEVDVRNTGSVAGQEVVQLYSRQPVASRSRPLRELRAFEKVLLRPGEMRTVRFTVTRDQFAFHDDSGTALIEPGVIEFYAGGSSTADLMERFDFQ
jgi:beta-glucosidase